MQQESTTVLFTKHHMNVIWLGESYRACGQDF